MKLLKKSVSLLLALCMILSFVPMNVFAAAPDTSNDDFYKIVHLDCGRKYFTEAQIKAVIDEMAEQGLNQLELYLADNQGLRLALDAGMKISVGGVEYDLTRCLGDGYMQDSTMSANDNHFKPSGDNGYLTQTEMTSIIQYAKGKGIEIVPCINVPGHMGAILNPTRADDDIDTSEADKPFSDLRYGDAISSIDLTNQNAIDFALAVTQLYVNYFAGQGCKFYSIGADEYGYDAGLSVAGLPAAGLYDEFVSFMNKCAEIIEGANMTPRAFNDAFCLDSTNEIDTDYQVYFWNGSATQLDAIEAKGYDVINTSQNIYWAVGSSWAELATVTSNLKTFDYKQSFGGGEITNPQGAMMCVWNDVATYRTADNIVSELTVDASEDSTTTDVSLLALYANSLAAAGPVVIELDIDETSTQTFTVTGEYTAEELTTKYNFGSIATASNISVTPGTDDIPAVPPTAATELVSGNSYVFSDGNGNYLTSSLGSTTVASEAGKWVITLDETSGNYYIQPEGSTNYLSIENVSSGKLSLLSGTQSAAWIYDSTTKSFKANRLKAWWPEEYVDYVLSYSDGAWVGVEAGTAPATLCTLGTAAIEGTDPVTTFSITGAENGTFNFTAEDGTDYRVIVGTGMEAHTCNSNVAATCNSYAKCDICGATTGTTYDESNHAGPVSEATCQDEAHCSACDKDVSSELADHTYSAATCQTLATCSVCGATTGELGGHQYTVAANCHSGTTCSVCGAEDTTTEKDSDNHAGGTEIRDAKEATETETGYTGDLYCLGCNTKIADGAVIPVVNPNAKVITIAVGGAYEIVIDGKDATASIDKTNLNEATATVVGVLTPGTDPTPEILPSAATELVSGSSYVFSDGNGNYLTSSLGSTTVASEAGKWVITLDETSGNYYIQPEGSTNYLSIENVSSGKLSLLSGTQSAAWIYDSTTKSFKANRLKAWWPEEYVDYVLSYSDGAWVGVEAGTAPATLCIPGTPAIEGTDPKTTVTFTGVTEGTTYVTVDGVEYQINVVDAALMDAVLATPTWMTNRKVSGFLDASGNSITFTEQITAADNIALTTAAGVALTDVIPPEATTVNEADTDSNAIFWRGMRHAAGQVQGTVADFHQVGDVINYVRYDKTEAKWYGSADRVNWLDLTGYTLDIYYLQETAVTKEVITEVVDWGEDYDKGLAWEAATYVLLDFAVAMDGVPRHPALDSFPNDGDGTTVENQKTIAFHCTHTSDDKTSTVNGYWQRRVDTIFAVETMEYEVYMITLTRTNDDPSVQLPGENSNACGDYTYAGEEKIVWTIDEDTFEEKYGQTTSDGKTLGAFAERPANFDITQKADKMTVYRTVGGDPIVDYVQIYENQGLLVTYYVRAKKTEDSLTVHYRLEGTTTDFHSYYIAVQQGEYFDNGFAPADNTYGLMNNDVEDLYGNDHIVTSDVTKLFDIPSQYRSGYYAFNKHIQFVLDDGTVIEQTATVPEGKYIKEVILYYDSNNVHYVPVDFGSPLEFNASFFNHHISEGLSVEGITMTASADDDDADEWNGIYGSFTTVEEGVTYKYTPYTVLKGREKLVSFTLTLKDANGETHKEIHDVVVLPATSVYYEEAFFTNNNGWTIPGYPTAVQQTRCYNDDIGYAYGYDSIYSAVGASNGSQAEPAVDAETGARTVGSSMQFSFKGDGVDIYANCTTDSGVAMVILRNSSNNIERILTVDTKVVDGSTTNATLYTFDKSYNVPIVAIRGLTHGEYTVEIRLVLRRGLEAEQAEPVYIDGFRVYNTLQSSTTNDDVIYESSSSDSRITASDIYKVHTEQNPTFVELRDVYLATVYSSDTYKDDTTTTDKEAIYADEIAENTLSQVYGNYGSSVSALVVHKSLDQVTDSADSKVKTDIIDNGPKNEIYLFPGQTLLLSCSADALQIGLKALDQSVSYSVNGGTAVSLSTSTDMFYRVSQSYDATSQAYTLSITNNGSGVLAVTKLKVVSYGAVASTSNGLQPFTTQSLTKALANVGFSLRSSAPATPAVKEGIVSEDGKLYYYVDGVKTYGGLMLIDGDYYYARTSGEIVTGRDYWITKTNDLLPAATYTFGEDGKMINPPVEEEGIVEEDGKLYYYVDGVKTYGGLMLIDGDYYYARTSGEIVCGRDYWITKTNDLLPAAKYTFGEDGKMIDPPTTVEPEVKNGICADETGKLYYYVDGVKTYGGLMLIDGDYYYARTSGEIVCGKDYWITKTNDLLPAAKYTFGEDGKMVN